MADPLNRQNASEAREAPAATDALDRQAATFEALAFQLRARGRKPAQSGQAGAQPHDQCSARTADYGIPKKQDNNRARLRINLQPESHQFRHLDALRFLSALGVVAHHYSGTLGYSGTDGLTALVDLFFVISGVIIAHTYGSRLRTPTTYADYVRRRIARLWPLHLAVIAFYLALWTASRALEIPLNDASRYDASCLAPNVFMTHAFGVCRSLTFNGPSWSISAEMGVYLAAPALFWIVRRGRLPTAAAVVSVIALLSSQWGVRWMTWTFDGGVLRALPSFLLGVLLHDARALLGRVFAPRAWLVAGAVAFLTAQAYAPRPVLLALVYMIAAAALAADQHGGGHPVTTALAGLGRLTYSIYMLHTPLWTLCVGIVGQHLLHLDGPALLIWVSLTVFLLIVIAAPLSLFGFETPLRRLVAGERPWRRIDAPVATPHRPLA